jgi:hypothetical protein
MLREDFPVAKNEMRELERATPHAHTGRSFQVCVPGRLGPLLRHRSSRAAEL